MANIINGVWRKALKDVEIKGKFLNYKLIFLVMKLYNFLVGE